MKEILLQNAGKFADKSAFLRDMPGMGKQLFLGFIPTQVVWNIIILLVVALILYWLIRSSHKKETPLDILKARYAKGEIDHDDYVKMKKELK